jgi:hypothetical protein
MTTLRRLLPVAVLSLSACLVSTDDLKPRTDADCVAQDPSTKACGYKCVSREDPATGCGGSGCAPCDVSGIQHVVPLCDASHSCAFACAEGWETCDGSPSDGCETFLWGSDPGNCGACGRACPPGGTCTEGVCAPLVELDVYPSVPRGILNHQGKVYFVQDDVDPTYQALGVVTGTYVAGGLGHVRWLAGDPTNAEVWATGTKPSGNVWGFELALTEIDVSTVTPAVVYKALDPLSSSEYLDGNAVTGAGRVLFTSSMDTDLFVFDPLAVSSQTTFIDLPGAVSGTPRGIAPFADALGKYYLFGYSDRGGTLSFVRELPGGVGGEQIALTGAGTPSRLAVWQNPLDLTRNIVFWASEDDGGVRWAVPGEWANWSVAEWPTGPTSLMDITADAQGVYWTNRSTGLVTMWSAATGKVVPLAWSTSPFGIATSVTRVYWTDDVEQVIYYTTKY